LCDPQAALQLERLEAELATAKTKAARADRDPAGGLGDGDGGDDDGSSMGQSASLAECTFQPSLATAKVSDELYDPAAGGGGGSRNEALYARTLTREKERESPQPR